MPKTKRSLTRRGRSAKVRIRRRRSLSSKKRVLRRTRHLSGSIRKLKTNISSESASMHEPTEKRRAGGNDIHSMVEKVANLTSRWGKTASLMSIIGNNLKVIGSPVLRNINPFKLAGFNTSSMPAEDEALNETDEETGGNESSRETTPNLNMDDLMSAAQSVLSSMNRNQSR